ncbi:HlyD family secretion protein [Massilia sp. CCM 8734]|uniref:HlyD family secretion protein n=1 Tax=Massilia sp. CCM 8734 TaxID=2609283 RepID=UPI001424229C|nr:HlyD family efflux transporter periplasmic adaptor subunit [Massilia sp. CCM 8734]NIA00767.1 HlyD family efflux transporter periplasmic adaptor subunit [Massilia sp. CCM 8734]
MASTDKNSPLFRPEVTASLSQQWMGAIRLAQPISGWLIACIATMIATAFIVFAVTGSMTKKARVSGVLIPVGGSISIVAPNAALLIQSNVKEGDRVAAGQQLFQLSTERQSGGGEITALVAQQLITRQQTLEAEQRLRTSNANDRTAAITLRLSNMTTEATQLEQEIVLMQRRQSLAQDSVDKYQTLQANGFVSSAQVQQKQEEVIDVASRLSNIERTFLQLKSNRIALEAERQALTNSLATEQAQLSRAIASLQQEIAENGGRKAIVITTSQAGTITTLTSQPGQSLIGGQVLATLIPAAGSSHGAQADPASGIVTASILEAHLYAPSRTTGFVAKGQKVLIRYQAYPYQKFGLQNGTVTDVSTTPFAPSELPPNLATTILSSVQQNAMGAASGEALYRIKVKLDKQSIEAYGQNQAVKPGMTLEADVLQDRRAIWEWVMEPILAVARR